MPLSSCNSGVRLSKVEYLSTLGYLGNFLNKPPVYMVHGKISAARSSQLKCPRAERGLSLPMFNLPSGCLPIKVHTATGLGTQKTRRLSKNHVGAKEIEKPQSQHGYG